MDHDKRLADSEFFDFRQRSIEPRINEQVNLLQLAGISIRQACGHDGSDRRRQKPEATNRFGYYTPVVGSIWAGVISPLGSRLDNVEKKMDDRSVQEGAVIAGINSKIVELLLTLREFNAYQDDIKTRYMDSQKGIDEDLLELWS